MKPIVAALCFFICSSAFADGIAGVYVGSGHYGQVVILPHGPNYRLTTCGRLQQNCYPISAEIQPIDKFNFQSVKGSITVNYGDDCNYSIAIHVTLDGPHIFISETGPSAFPSRWEYESCPEESDLHYRSYAESVAYTRQ